MNTHPARCPALQRIAEPHPPRIGPSVTRRCTSLRRCSSRTLQRGRDTNTERRFLTTFESSKRVDTRQHVLKLNVKKLWGETIDFLIMLLGKEGWKKSSQEHTHASVLLNLDALTSDHSWSELELMQEALPITLIRWQCTSSVSSTEILFSLRMQQSVWPQEKKLQEEGRRGGGKRAEPCHRFYTY